MWYILHSIVSTNNSSRLYPYILIMYLCFIVYVIIYYIFFIYIYIYIYKYTHVRRWQGQRRRRRRRRWQRVYINGGQPLVAGNMGKCQSLGGDISILCFPYVSSRNVGQKPFQNLREPAAIFVGPA